MSFTSTEVANKKLNLTETIQVKRQGDFEPLLIIKTDEDFSFEGKLIDRDELNEGLGKIIRVPF